MKKIFSFIICLSLVIQPLVSVAWFSSRSSFSSSRSFSSGRSYSSPSKSYSSPRNISSPRATKNSYSSNKRKNIVTPTKTVVTPPQTTQVTNNSWFWFWHYFLFWNLFSSNNKTSANTNTWIIINQDNKVETNKESKWFLEWIKWLFR